MKAKPVLIFLAACFISIAAKANNLVLTPGGGFQSVQAPVGTQAVRVESLMKTLGVSGHVAEYGANANTVSDAMYLNLRLWRDGIGGLNAGQFAVIQSLVNAGLKIIGLPGGAVPPANQSVANNIRDMKTVANMAPGALMAVEGPNEPGNFPFYYGGVSTATSWSVVANFQKDYYSAEKGDSVLGSIPVWDVSLTGQELDNYGLQFLTVPAGHPEVLSSAGTVFADVINEHIYPMFQTQAAQYIAPVKGDAFINQLTADHVLTYTAPHFAGYTLAQAIALPRAITETGFGATGGTPGGATVDIPTQGKNLLTGFLNAWNEGYISFLIYTFYEQTGGWGILTSGGVPKASGTYLHNFTTPLVDKGANAATFSPDQLSFTLSGMPPTAKRQLFEKSNGNFELVLWNNVTNWDVAAGAPIAVGANNVTVNFGQSQPVVNTYDPVVQDTPVATTSGTSVVVALKDYPMVVEVVSGTGIPVNFELDPIRGTRDLGFKM
jgi:hypothetical protein